MLTPDLDRYATESKYGADSVYSALGILRSIQRVSERTILLDACRSDLVTSGTYTTDSISDLIDFNNPEDGSSALLNVADFYHVVNSCNFYLANVDTTVTENNEKTMLREWAEVQAMRAWAYVQLVRFYGEVPFVTAPVGSTDEAEAAQKSAPKVNASNLAALLTENGLEKAILIQTTKGLPNYESFNNGSASFDSKRNFFPASIVYADACLMANNYEKAAEQYYNYFVYGDAVPAPGFNNDNYRAGAEKDRNTNVYYINSGNHVEAFSNGALGKQEIITAATGAANSSYGMVLPQIQHIYGFKTTTAGQTSVQAYEQNQQVIPSAQYISLNKAQRYNVYTEDGEARLMEEAIGGDGRLVASAPEMSFMNGNKSRIIDKFAPSKKNNVEEKDRIRFGEFDMNYHVPLYRMPVVLLRFAEAVNRLGFPELAFGILKDGLATQNLPQIVEVDVANSYEKLISVYDAEKDTTTTDTVPYVVIGKLKQEGNGYSITWGIKDSSVVVYGDKHIGDPIYAYAHDSIPNCGTTLADIPQEVQDSWHHVGVRLEPIAGTGGMYYLSTDELMDMQKYPFLDFTRSQFNSTDYLNTKLHYGIHARGCGDVAGRNDTVYTYARQVAEKIAEDKARAEGLSYAAQMEYAASLYSGDTLLVEDKALIQNAVENIIVDEIALETAFEGNRFCDLVRIAEHKSMAGLKGEEWLAWKIARRNQNYTDDASKVDAALKAKLLNKQNWYLTLPE